MQSHTSHQWERSLAGLLACFAFAVGNAGAAAGQETVMESIEPFLMERTEEIALARTAGPRGIGDRATILVLTPSGYETAVSGNNGFSCFVGRGWSGPVVFTRPDGTRVVSPDALDPRLRAPHCFNPAAAETVLPWHLYMTEQLLAGTSFERLAEKTAAALQAGELRAPGPGAFAYMTSPHQFIGSAFGAWRPHVMLYVPYATDALWGADGLSNEFPFVAEDGTAWAVVIIPIAEFSDGSRPAVDP